MAATIAIIETPAQAEAHAAKLAARPMTYAEAVAALRAAEAFIAKYGEWKASHPARFARFWKRHVEALKTAEFALEDLAQDPVIFEARFDALRYGYGY